MHARSALLLPLVLLFGVPVLLPAAVPAALAVTAKKPPHKAVGPRAIGTFEDWTAATNRESGQTVCYAFTYAKSSSIALPGRGRVVMTVTERTGGRDAVAISAGFTYPENASVAVSIDNHPPEQFYTAQRSAFSRDGHATVEGFLKGLQVVATSPAPKNAQVIDTFSLRGFNAAYGAIVKACPPGRAEK